MADDLLSLWDSKMFHGFLFLDVISEPMFMLLLIAPTQLQTQTGKFVKLCAGIAADLFTLVGTVTFSN